MSVLIDSGSFYFLGSVNNVITSKNIKTIMKIVSCLEKNTFLCLSYTHKEDRI